MVYGLKVTAQDPRSPDSGRGHAITELQEEAGSGHDVRHDRCAAECATIDPHALGRAQVPVEPAPCYPVCAILDDEK